jgi:hypothetical protein
MTYYGLLPCSSFPSLPTTAAGEVVTGKAPTGRSTRPGRTDDRPAERDGRRRRFVFYVVGGLLGSGGWLSVTIYSAPVLKKVPANVHVPQLAVATCAVAVACWGLLLVGGEAMLFALAVTKSGDQERYDVYRNLMILWGYVLTLGLPRLFRRLPAQFAGTLDEPDADRAPARRPARTEGSRGAGARSGERCRPDDGGRSGAGRSRRREEGFPESARPPAPRDPVPGPPVRGEEVLGGVTPMFGDVELRTALDLLLRYAVRYLDDEAAAASKAPAEKEPARDE